MLSRLKGATSRTRTGSESSAEQLQQSNSPTKTRERNDRDSLSPDRARTSRSRSSSVNQSAAPPATSAPAASVNGDGARKRRSGNYSMPEPNSTRYSLGVGQGTLTFDQIPAGTHSESTDQDSPELDYVSPANFNSPNKINTFLPSTSSLTLAQVDEDPLLTPTPSSANQHPPFDSVIVPSPSLTVIQPLRGRSASSASARPSFYRAPSPNRMVSLPVAPADQQNGLTALAQLNSASPPPAITTTTNSRQLSRSASVNSDSRTSSGRPSQETNSASSSRKSTLLSPESIVTNGSTAPTPSVNGKSASPLKKIKSSSGIAAAMIAAGVNLSPVAARQQPLPLSRVTTRGSDTGSGENDYFGSERNGLLSALDIESDFDDAMSQLGTGYAVASSRRNAEFHSLFRNISEDDYLIEDYGCALQREILIQGRLYLSEHHLSFNANIFGWVTSHTLPFSEIVSIEKRSTAYVIPNAIQVTTLHTKHTFTSFLSRDTTYDLIVNLWRMVHPITTSELDQLDDTAALALDEFGNSPAQQSMRRLLAIPRRLDSPLGSSHGEDGSNPPTMERRGSTMMRTTASRAELPVHKPTVDTCQLLSSLKEVALDVVFPSAPEKIYNLMFTSGFMKEFWLKDQKLMELQVSDWAPEKSGSNLLTRSLSYIKPLFATMGPKQTKCLIVEETAHVDFDDFVCVITTTRTPDVPSGGSFSVKTRTSMTWAKGNSCRVVVTTGVEWTKSSFLKGIIERSCIEGQRTYHVDLERAMRAYIHAHRSEFLEEGQAEDSDSPSSTKEESSSLKSFIAEHPNGERYSHHRSATNDTISSPVDNVITRALEESFLHKSYTALRPLFLGFLALFDGSRPAGPILIVVILLFSNIWTLTRPVPLPSSRHPSSTNGGRGRSPNEVAMAVREALQDWFRENQAIPSTLATASTTNESHRRALTTMTEECFEGGEEGLSTQRKEAREIGLVVAELEARLTRLKESLNELD